MYSDSSVVQDDTLPPGVVKRGVRGARFGNGLEDGRGVEGAAVCSCCLLGVAGMGELSAAVLGHGVAGVSLNADDGPGLGGVVSWSAMFCERLARVEMASRRAGVR